MSTQAGDEIMASYIVTLGKQLSKIEKYIVETQSKSLDRPVHNIQPMDYVYVKSLAKKTLESQ